MVRTGCEGREWKMKGGDEDEDGTYQREERASLVRSSRRG